MERDTKVESKSVGKQKYFIPIVIVCGICAIYIVFSIVFSNRFCFGTTVNGINASMMSPASMEKRIAEAAKNYEIKIESNGTVVDTIRGESINLASNPKNGEVEKFLASQNGFAWPAKLFNRDEFVGKRLVTFDRKALQDEVSTLNCVKSTDFIPTEDATFEFVKDKFTVVEEVYGTEIEENYFARKIGENIRLLHSSVDLEKDQLYKQPEIKKDDKGLKSTVDDLNSMLGTTISYDEGEKISGKEISSWIISTPDTPDKFSFDEEAIKEYVSELAKKYNTAGKPKELKTSYGNTVTVPGGNYGWKIDVEGETGQIIEDIKAKKDVKREFVYQFTANSHDKNDYGDSYVEVNLSAQHLFLYVKGTKILDTPFVSGNLSRGNGTHTGAFRIAYCQRNAVLRGDNYETPVNFWMPFNMGEGLHDALWRSSFGGNIFRTNGSHGCVNLPYNAAAKIYEKVSAGFPVLVYSTGGTENTGTAVSIPNGQAGSNQAAIKDVTAKIGAIGQVTLAKEAQIAGARAAYNALSKEDKAKVSNIAVLSQAEATLQGLKTEASKPVPQPAPQPVPQPAPQPVPQPQPAPQPVPEPQPQPVVPSDGEQIM